MARGVLVAAVIVVILLMIAAITMLLMGISMKARDNVLNASDNMQLGKSSLFGQDFWLSDVHYFNRSLAEGNFNSSIEICDREAEIIIARAAFKNDRLPDSCEISVDNRPVKTIDTETLRCKTRCDGDETLLVVDLPAQPLRKEHEIALCCDTLCLTEILPSIC